MVYVLGAIGPKSILAIPQTFNGRPECETDHGILCLTEYWSIFEETDSNRNNGKSVFDRTENSSKNCSCPPEYKGQFCEQCASGYTRTTPNGGPYVTCVPCQCHGDSDKCHPETGECMDHLHTTTGMDAQPVLVILLFEIVAVM